MGRKSVTGGVRAKGKDRIEFTFTYGGRRYRPTLRRAPTEAILRRARVQLEAIKLRIDAGTFSFMDEFPDYRYEDRLPDVRGARTARLTCNQVFDAYLAHCDARVAMNDMAFSTFDGYRKILDSIWRPQIGSEAFEEIRYSRLAGIVAGHTRNKKTYNNVVSTVRCAFDFGYRDHPEKPNPAAGLKTLRITKKDRLPIDPFTIQEGERIIAESHAEFGLAHGNYEEFRFFTGLRQSEQIALQVGDCDLLKGKMRIARARVLGRDKDRTKTREDREIILCGRALEVLKRQLALREQLAAAGELDHELVFFQADGAPIDDLSYPYDRWRYIMAKTRIRYREPYNARHTYISWRLMAGHNVLLVAKEDGHSVHTMLTTYAAWTDGATEADLEAIRAAMQQSPALRKLGAGDRPERPLEAPGFATNLPPEGDEKSQPRQWGRLSWRKYRQGVDLGLAENWRSGRDSNPRPPA
ncbi:MAG: Arm DNA-binding domain-containing protein [Planctomycetaceae bacterium]